MNSKLNEYKKNFPILLVIKSFLTVTKKGSNYWAVCPFHADSKPSLSISEEKNIFKCFSCNVAGDSVSFVMKYKKCSYVEAINQICAILGLNSSDFLSEKHNLYSKIFELNDLVANSYHRYLFNFSSKKYLDFLVSKRKLSIETIKKYKIGFAPEKDILSSIFESFNRSSTSKKFEEKDFEIAGIFIKNQDQKKIPFFSSRIIFPIFSENNKIVGFSGRAVDENENLKYLNSKSSEIFSKQNTLFNIQNLEKNKKIFLYEGFFDVLNAESAGFSNGLALMGSNLDFDLFLKLKKFSNQIILVFDNDDTGRKLNIKVFEKAVKIGFVVEITNFLKTNYKDIDEFLKEEKEQAKNALKKSINFFEWFYEYWSLENKNINSVNLQIFIKRSLDFLFFEENNEIFLISGVAIEYAKKCLEVIFNFYSKSSEFKKPEYMNMIAKKKEEYEKSIMKNLIQDKEAINEEVIENSLIEKNQIVDISNSSVIYYRKVLFYLERNYAKILKQYDFKNWFFDIPEEFLLFEFVKVFLSIFKKYLTEKGENLSSEEKEFLNNLKEKKHNSFSVSSINNFFNSYFSFNNSYLNDVIKFLDQDISLKHEEKFMEKFNKKMKLRALINENKKISSIFFKKFFLFEKN